MTRTSCSEGGVERLLGTCRYGALASGQDRGRGGVDTPDVIGIVVVRQRRERRTEHESAILLNQPESTMAHADAEFGSHEVNVTDAGICFRAEFVGGPFEGETEHVSKTAVGSENTTRIAREARKKVQKRVHGN